MEEYVKTKGFLKDTLKELKQNIKDLEAWSVYHNDKYNEEISEIESTVQTLERAVNGKS